MKPVKERTANPEYREYARRLDSWDAENPYSLIRLHALKPPSLQAFCLFVTVIGSLVYSQKSTIIKYYET